VHEKITQSHTKYPLRSYVFCPSKQSYVIVKKFDEKTNTYECRVFDPKADSRTESKELVLRYEELSSFINVCVQLQQNAADKPKCYSNFKVDINEKIHDVLFPLLNQAFGKGSSLLYKDKIVTMDDTFFQKHVMPADVFLAGGKGKQPAVRWRRYKEIQNTSYTGASKDYEDALKFKARRDLYWCGFLWTQEYNKKDFKLEVRWRVNSEAPSEWVEFSASPDDKDPDFDHLHTFDIQDQGFKPVFVPEGSFIDIAAKCPGANQFCYIYSGYPDTYKNIKEQEYDFDTHYSDWNRNCTDSDWGFFPGVLYYPA